MKRARELADPLAVRRAATHLGVDRSSVPPRSLRARVGTPAVGDFVTGGREAAGELVAALDVAGVAVQELRSVLDFGCGPGRVLPHLAAMAPHAECSGCDVDATAIRWAASAHPELSWAVSGFDPPLPFDAERFELVYSISVISHLDEQRADRWLAEIRRVLRPGGLALLSVHGAYAFEEFRAGRVRTAWAPQAAFEGAALAADGFAFVPYVRSVWNERDLPGVEGEYGLAFDGDEYLREHWSATFEVLAVHERAMTSWQDIVVCRK